MKRLAVIVMFVSLMFAAAPQGAAQTDPPEGIEKIAFVAWDEAATTYTLDVVDPDGSNHTTLVIGRVLWSPAWSPDGSTLAFLGKTSTGARNRIYLIDSDGANLRAVDLPTPISMFPEWVTWSADGTALIYAAVQSGQVRFYQLDMESGEAERIPIPGIDHFQQSWIVQSPDGPYAVWAYESSSIDNRLYVVDAEVGVATPFPGEAPDGNSYDRLAWSPDGERVALAVMSGQGQEPQRPLAVANADGSDLRVLLNGSPRGIASPVWSPDGEQIAFVAFELDGSLEPPFRPYIVGADGSNLRMLDVDALVWPDSGLSWGVVPAGTIMPSAPVLLEDAAR